MQIVNLLLDLFNSYLIFDSFGTSIGETTLGYIVKIPKIYVSVSFKKSYQITFRKD